MSRVRVPPDSLSPCKASLQHVTNNCRVRTYINQQLYPGEFLLHRKYAQSDMLLDLIWTHSNIVADIAISIFEKNEFDKSQLVREFIIQSALLMDIGVYSCGGYEWMPSQPQSNKPYIQHTVIGAWILEQEGYAPQVVQVAHNHTGVGISAKDVRDFGLDLPEADYVPHSPLEKLIAYASKFHSKAPKFKTAEEIKNSLSHYGTEKVKTFETWMGEFGPPQLEDVTAKYEDWHRSFHFQIEQLTKTATQATPNNLNLNSAGIAN